MMLERNEEYVVVLDYSTGRVLWWKLDDGDRQLMEAGNDGDAMLRRHHLKESECSWMLTKARPRLVEDENLGEC